MLAVLRFADVEGPKEGRWKSSTSTELCDTEEARVAKETAPFSGGLEVGRDCSKKGEKIRRNEAKDKSVRKNIRQEGKDRRIKSIRKQEKQV